MDMKQENYRYFLFSKEQFDTRTQTEKRLGRTYYPGKVIINGKPHPFTEMTSEPPTNHTRYTDYELIAEGDITQMKYNEPYKE